MIISINFQKKNSFKKIISPLANRMVDIVFQHISKTAMSGAGSS